MRDPLSRVRIRYKLPLGFFLICLVAFGVGGVILTSEARSALETQIAGRLDERAIAAGQILDRHLDLLRRRVEDFASDGYIRTQVEDLGGLVEDPVARKRIAADLRKHLHENKLALVESFVGAIVYDATGESVLVVPDDAPGEASTVQETVVGPLRPAGGVHPHPNFLITTPLWSLTGRQHLGSLQLVVWADTWIDGMEELSELPSMPLQGMSLVAPGVVRLPIVRGPPSSRLEGAGQGHVARSALDQPDWMIELSVDNEVLMAPVVRLRNRYLWTGLILLLITAGVLFFPVRFLLQPLTKFSEAARRIGKGEFSARVEHESGDEIGDLARAFNIMAGAVDDRTQQLKKAAEVLRGREQMIRTERNRLDAVIQNMEDGLFILDADGNVTLANAAARPLLGALADEDPRRLECAHKGDVRTGCLSCLAEVDKGQQTCVVERVGRIFDIHTTALPAGPGERPSRLCVSRDVTTRIGQQESQGHQERMAVLGEVAAVMAHELNNPLAAISMFSEMLEEQLDGQESQRESAAVIRRNVASCKRTIAGLLDLAARGRMEIGVFDVHDLLVDATGLLLPIAQRARVELRVESGAETGVIVADEVRLRQVLINLVMNGIQACGRGGQVTLVTADAPDAVVIDVRDTGTGVPETSRDRIFEPFFTTKGPGAGTGLGLPTSRRIVEEHGGRLTLVDSGPEGATFRIQMPRKAARRAWEAQARLDVAVTSEPGVTGEAMGGRTDDVG
ncbi:MAG: HAMP domain-containing protein [bacterium]|nr:HAMP domain-containing protein [bacterium]